MTRGYDPARVRTQIRRVSVIQMCRIFPARHRLTPLGVEPTPSRFSDREGRYSVLYAAKNVRTSFLEAVVRNRLSRRSRRKIPADEVESRSIVWVDSLADLMLVDLRADGPLRVGAPTAVSRDTNHSAGRSLSAFVHANVPEAEGFLYTSRFSEDPCIAVFDRAIVKLAATMVISLMDSPDLHDVLDEYDITLSRP